MVDLPKEGPEQKETRIRHGRVEWVDVFDLKENELEIFEKGSPADIQLNFAIFLLSAAVTALCSLLTAKFDSQITTTVFIVLTIVGFLGGILLLLLWRSNHTSMKQICKRIRDRIPSEVRTPPIAADDQPKG